MTTTALNSNFSSVDRMLPNNFTDNDKARELRQVQTNARKGGVSDGGEGDSLRERTMSAQKSALKLEADKKAKDSEGAPNALQMGTGKLLQQAWINLIPSFGLTLIWINIHAFMRMIPGFSSVFCKIGDEWVPKEAKAITGEMGQMGSGIGLIEKAGIVFLDIAVIMIILIAVATVMMILDFAFGFGWFFVIKDSVVEFITS